MKKTIPLLAVLAGTLWLCPALSAEEAAGVQTGSREINFAAGDVLPYTENGQTLIPVRAVAEALGLQVSWDGSSRTVAAEKAGMNFTLTVGSSEAVVNGGPVELALPAEIKDGRTFVPLSFVAENLAAVDWDGENGILKMEPASGAGNNPAVQSAATLPEEPVREAYNETVRNTHFHIPAINLPADDAEKINQEIWDILYSRVLMTFKDWSKEYDLWVNDTEYRYAVNDAVLSLVISYGQEPEIDFEEYLVYNLDTETGRRLSDAELLAKAGITQEAYELKLKQALGSGLWAVFDNGAEWLSDAGFNELFNDRLEKTLAGENLRDCRPFLNEKGELCAVARKYSLAGGDYYYGVVNLADFELKPNFDRKAEVPEP